MHEIIINVTPIEVSGESPVSASFMLPFYNRTLNGTRDSRDRQRIKLALLGCYYY